MFAHYLGAPFIDDAMRYYMLIAICYTEFRYVFRSLLSLLLDLYLMKFILKSINAQHFIKIEKLKNL